MKIALGDRAVHSSPMTPDEIKNRSDSFRNYVEAKKTTSTEPNDFINSVTPGLHFGYGGDTTCVEIKNKAGNSYY